MPLSIPLISRDAQKDLLDDNCWDWLARRGGLDRVSARIASLRNFNQITPIVNQNAQGNSKYRENPVNVE
ncbi:hypothetical protein LP415_09780 [Polaromonas sp. P1(28)-8]|nr:hypothetical protein LP415_09780 [Polaromonas sp. P1(28)-8]